VEEDEGEEVDDDDADDDDADDDDDALPDPRTTSRFDRVAIDRTGKRLVLSEIDSEGTTHIGLYDLSTADYRRLAALSAYRIIADPTHDRVAVMTESDTEGSDSEVVLVDLETGAITPVTVNDVEDDLVGWDRAGTSVLVHHSAQDAADRWSHPVYRYDVD
jgi:hypothetical protein